MDKKPHPVDEDIQLIFETKVPGGKFDTLILEGDAMAELGQESLKIASAFKVGQLESDVIPLEGQFRKLDLNNEEIKAESEFNYSNLYYHHRPKEVKIDDVYVIASKAGIAAGNSGHHIMCPILGLSAIEDHENDKERAFIKFVKGFGKAKGPLTKLTLFITDEGLYERFKKLELAQYDEQGEERKADASSNAMLSDAPIDDISNDRLGFTKFANAIAGVIDSKHTVTPLTFVINAPWGAGKSSLGHLLKNSLEASPAESPLKHQTLWFNAWSHDDAENLKSAFTGFIARELNSKRGFFNQCISPLPGYLTTPGQKITKRLVLAVSLIVLALCIWAFSDIQSSFVGLEALLPASSLALIPLIRLFIQMTSTINAFVKKPSTVADSGNIFQVRKDLHRLIDQAVPDDRRIIIFVDDLERCRKTGPIDLLESINQLLDHKKIVVIIMADILSVAASAEIKYADMVERYNPADASLYISEKAPAGTYGRLYIQKLIQLQFDLPIFKPERMSRFIEGVESKRLDERKKLEEEMEDELLPEFPVDRSTSLMTAGQFGGFSRLIKDKNVKWYSKFLSVILLIILAPMYISSGLMHLIVHSKWKTFNVFLDQEGSWMKIVLTIPALVLLTLYTMFGINYYNWSFERNTYYNSDLEAHVSQFSDFAKNGLLSSTAFRLGTRTPGQSDTRFLTEGVRNEEFEISQLMIDSMNYYYNEVFFLKKPGLRELMGPKGMNSEALLDSLQNQLNVLQARYDDLNTVKRSINQLDSLESASLERQSLLRLQSARQFQVDRQDTIFTNIRNGFDSAYDKVAMPFYSKVYEGQRMTFFTLYAKLLLLFIAFFLVLSGSFKWRAFKLEAKRLSNLGKGQDDTKASKANNDDTNGKGKSLKEQLDELKHEIEKDNVERKRAFEKITDDNPDYEKAREKAVRYLSLALPRNSKRVANKLRLQVLMAHETNTLLKVETDYYAKWVALQEAYPEFVTHVSRVDGEMKSIEREIKLARYEERNLTSNPTYQKEEGENPDPWEKVDEILEAINPSYKGNRELTNLIMKDKLLSNRIDFLVYYGQDN